MRLVCAGDQRRSGKKERPKGIGMASCSGEDERTKLARGRYDLVELAVDRVAVPRTLSREAPVGTAGYVHSFESAGTLDGPGIRFVIFTTGCPLRCLYCHNPDTWQQRNGRLMTVDQVMAEIEKYADFLIRWKSGVTFSGGEPLAQPDFLANLLRRCKQRGLHTAIDTSGQLGHRLTQTMLDDADLFLLDLKAYDDSLHRRITGAGAAASRQFAERLAEAGKRIWIRFVLVPALTDDFDDIEKLADFVCTLRTVERVEVLPFHKMGEAKWQALGLEYRLGKTPPPPLELVERVVGQFRSRGLETY